MSLMILDTLPIWLFFLLCIGMIVLFIEIGLWLGRMSLKKGNLEKESQVSTISGSILGLLLVTALVLWIACHAIRRMQVSYGTET